ncbi:MAG: hypothetical protein ACH346_06600 [Chthoniobacterales bacterium]
MKTEHNLTPGQEQLWIKASKLMEENNYFAALSWAQLLLQSKPEFFEARVLARQAAQYQLKVMSCNLLERYKIKFYSFIALKKIKRLIKKESFFQAMIALESLLGKAPQNIAAHHVMVELAMQWKPPLQDVAFLSLETLVQADLGNSKKHIALAAFCLKRDETGKAWNPARALNAYEAVLGMDPYHLTAIQGIKNATALLSMQQNGWDRDLL